jgi:hypothetical protein
MEPKTADVGLEASMRAVEVALVKRGQQLPLQLADPLQAFNELGNECCGIIDVAQRSCIVPVEEGRDKEASEEGIGRPPEGRGRRPRWLSLLGWW